MSSLNVGALAESPRGAAAVRRDGPLGVRLEGVLLAVAYLISAAALAGFATFAIYPDLVAKSQVSAATYARMMVLAPRGQIVIAFAVLAAVLTRRTRGRWFGAFAVLYLVSLAAELVGTTSGVPFGPYRYTDGFGWKWFAHVPVLIPASWFMMSLPSYAIAYWRFPRRAN